MNPARRRQIFERLRAANPAPRGELEYATPFELLVAVILSAQATDKGVNAATRKLFATAKTAEAILALGETGLIPYIQTIGLFRAKAKNIIGMCKMLLERHGGDSPKHGAIWLTLYPTVMVEWYPQVLVVSTLHPRGPRKTVNVVEFFYPEEIAAFEPDFVAAQQAAYMETVREDDEIAERMDAGRKVLMERGDNEVGPYQSPMEDGMQHFHEWYRQMMAEDQP